MLRLVRGIGQEIAASRKTSALRLVYSESNVRNYKGRSRTLAEQPKLFPVFLNLADRRVLVVGAGEVAAQKIGQLLPTGARITVVAPEISAATRTLANANPNALNLLETSFQSEHIGGADMVIAATDDPALNARVIAEARHLKILANSVDDPENCDFYTASTIDRGPLRIAISSEGKYPGLCVALRKFLEDVLPDEHSDDLERLTALRAEIKRRIPDAKKRGEILKAISRDVEKKYLGIGTEDPPDA